MYVDPKRERYIRSPVRQKIQHFKRFVENYRRHIVCSTLVYGIAAGLCLERCYCEDDSASSFIRCRLEVVLTLRSFQTTGSRPNRRASRKPQWWASPSPAARPPPSPSCFPTCSSPCVATSSRCAGRPSSTDTFRLTPPSISMASWP